MVGHIKDLIVKLIERHDSKRHREFSDECEALDIERLRLEDVRTFVALARDRGYTEVEIRQLISDVNNKQQFLVEAIDRNKLLAISDIDPLPEE